MSDPRPQATPHGKAQGGYSTAYPWRNADFRQLQRTWDAKLAEDGFVDIEPGHTLTLKDNHKTTTRKYEAAAGFGTAEYFRLAEKFLAVHRWPSPTHRRLWAVWCRSDYTAKAMHRSTTLQRRSSLQTTQTWIQKTKVAMMVWVREQNDPRGFVIEGSEAEQEFMAAGVMPAQSPRRNAAE